MSIFKKQPITVPDGFTVTAHTGAMHTPHNSLESALACIGCGADIIEVDVTLRRDGSFVLIHKSSAGDGEGVPIGDFFDLLEGNSVCVNLDLKVKENLAALQAEVKKRDLLKRAFFTGVGEDAFERVKTDAPEINAFLNFEADMAKLNNEEYANMLADKMKEMDTLGLNTQFRHLSKTLVDAVHSRGLLVSAWTVNKKADMRRVLLLDVDNVTTKNPLALMKIIDR